MTRMNIKLAFWRRLCENNKINEIKFSYVIFCNFESGTNYNTAAIYDNSILTAAVIDSHFAELCILSLGKCILHMIYPIFMRTSYYAYLSKAPCGDTYDMRINGMTTNIASVSATRAVHSYTRNRL